MNKEELIQGIASGDSRTLSKAITLAESTLPEKRNLALEVISHFGPQNNRRKALLKISLPTQLKSACPCMWCVPVRFGAWIAPDPCRDK